MIMYLFILLFIQFFCLTCNKVTRIFLTQILKFFIYSIEENLDYDHIWRIFYFKINRCYLFGIFINKEKKKIQVNSGNLSLKNFFYSQSHLIARHPVFHRRWSILRHTREISSLWSNRFQAYISVVFYRGRNKVPRTNAGAVAS